MQRNGCLAACLVLISMMWPDHKLSHFFQTLFFGSREVNKKVVPLPTSLSGHQIFTEDRYPINTSWGGDTVSFIEVAYRRVGERLFTGEA